MDCDDFLDAYDSDFEEDYGYDDGGDDSHDEAGEKSEDEKGTCEDRTYTVLEEADIRHQQEQEIFNISGTLSISKPAASLLLYHYSWNVSLVYDDWFADEEKVRAKVGLLRTVSLDDWSMKKHEDKEIICGICFDFFPLDQIYPTQCSHPYCITCWKTYIDIAINDGPGCLTLRCPEPACRAAVGQDVIDMLASDAEKKKYGDYLYRSYIEIMKRTKWCPAPGCENAVEFELGSSSNYDVTCYCSHTFCWNCGEDAHRPLDCDTVAKWVLKNTSEAENTTWILANSKPCPKCKRFIEKNSGCMHMTCTAPCKHEFCWLCFGDWKTHSANTGGYNTCNRYESEKQSGKYTEDDKRKEKAKKSLETYTHHYERWAANQKSRDIAIKDLHKLETVFLEQLSDKVLIPESQLKFIREGWLQIIECRRVLKWSYAYTYYIPEHEEAKKKFIEFSQGEAETRLEKLHECAEKELKEFLHDEQKQPEDFGDLVAKFKDLTKLATTYFENLVRALEQGLSVLHS